MPGANTAMIEAALGGLQRATKPRIVSPEDEMFVPDELAVRELQAAPGTVASNMSREDISKSLTDRLRGAFGLKTAESEQALRAAIAPREIEGQYRVRAAQEAARAQADRLAVSQDRQDARAAANRSSLDARSAANREAVSSRMAETREARGIPVTARNRLMGMRTAAEKAGQADTGILDRLKSTFTGTPTPNTRLQQFDLLTQQAQAIVEDYPDETVEDAIADLGLQLSSEEFNELSQLVLLMRGQ